MVRVEVEDAVATVTLNRPDALNALSRALMRALVEAFDALAARQDVAAIVLTGAGRAFCVGLDLKELGGEVETDTPLNADSADVSTAIDRVPQPIIAAVNGYAITGGFELALMCDLLIAGPDASFADTHARVGVVPGWGLSQRLPRLIGPGRAKEMSLTGNYIDAVTAERWGLVNRVVSAAELVPHCQRLARDMADSDPVVRAEIHRLIDTGLAMNLPDGLALERTANRAHWHSTFSRTEVAARRAAIQARARAQSGSINDR
ncbi:MAG: enoyl-CoA hydratase [Pseudomonadota bacterium]